MKNKIEETKEGTPDDGLVNQKYIQVTDNLCFNLGKR